MEEQHKHPAHLMEQQDLILAGFALPWALLFANSLLFGGLNLGFALSAIPAMGGMVWYLGRTRRIGGYHAAILVLCAVICAGLAWSDDNWVKLLGVSCLLFGWNLSYCLIAGKNRRNPGTAATIWDAFDTMFLIPMAHLAPSFRCLSLALQSNARSRKITGVFWGLLLSVPVLFLVVPLLISADAAFEGVIKLLPEVNLGQWIATAIAGGVVFAYTFGQAVGLTRETAETKSSKPRKKLSALTVNTALMVVSAVYVVYLFSQLAYFVGGFSGVLPQGYTVAQYATRGFFEMARLGTINLAVVSAALFAVRRADQAPLFTRVLCLFLGLVTEFLILSALAKMGLYIGSFGLTRRRVLVVAFLMFLGITTGAVSIHLFVEKLPYGKIAVITALVLCCALLWLDVDYQVAKYNVGHYRSGDLQTMDTWYLMDLGSGALPWIQELAQSGDGVAKRYLEEMVFYAQPENLRSWNYYAAQAGRISQTWWKGWQDSPADFS